MKEISKQNEDFGAEQKILEMQLKINETKVEFQKTQQAYQYYKANSVDRYDVFVQV